MSQKNQLGKGLQALISNINKDKPNITSNVSNTEHSTTHKETLVDLVSMELIEANPRQPRNTFEEETLQELATSLKTYGLIQPITLRKTSDGKYQIISGERRYRAAKLAGLKELPAYIRNANDNEVLEMALVENIQREDLSPIEIAISYQRLLDECNLTQEQLSGRVGKQRSTISNYIRLLKLSPEIQNALKNKKLSMGHARVIVGMEDLIQQMILFKEIQSKEISVREAEKFAQAFNKSKARKVVSEPKKVDADIKSVESKLSLFFGAKVNIQRKDNGEGQIIIKFNSDRALNDILDRLEENE